MPSALRAQEILAQDHDVAATVWSAPSFQQLRIDALETERWNRFHPEQPKRTPYVTRSLEHSEGPVVAVTDYMKAVPDQVARWIPQSFVSLGTDGSVARTGATRCAVTSRSIRSRSWWPCWRHWLRPETSSPRR
jgi:pyruvate dehydrogenase E1 component